MTTITATITPVLTPLILCLASLAGNAASAARPPNVVLVLIDDLGWMDLRCQGNESVETPFIDRLATQGMRFTRAYSAAPVCSPTRAAILTGSAPARLRITTHIPDRPDRYMPKGAKLRSAKTLDHLPLEHVTIAERLKEAGYATGFFGKWHLCGPTRRGDKGRGDERYHPEHQGFDVNLGGVAYGGPPTYFDPYRIDKLPPRKKGEYLPDRLADEAIDFMTANRKKPFFVALWNYTVHWPMEAPEALLEKYKDHHGPGLNDPRYGAMIEAMDRAIGRVLRALDELELAESTLFIFTSDNGAFAGVGDNRPLRESKGHLYEGGIRVPLIVRWPGVVKAGTACDVPVVSMDFYPTILAAAGLESRAGEAPDGESLLPLLRKSGGLKRDAIFFHYPNYAWHRSNRLGGAVVAGDLKLVEHYDDGSLELYDLSADIGETRNLSSEREKDAKRLSTRLHAWLEESLAEMPTRSE